MKIVVLDRSTIGYDIDLSALYALGEVVEYDNTLKEEVANRIADADTVIVNKIKLGKENLPFAKNLKLICVAATGYDNIDTDYIKEHSIALCNVPSYSTDSVAQVTVAMALSLANNLTSFREYVHSGLYTQSGKANNLQPVFNELSGKTWGVVGGGAIGTRVALIAKALGCKVIVCRQKQEGEFLLCDIDTLCKQSDIISLHIPLNDSTRNLINSKRISLMKKNAIVVNTARGAVTDENALAKAVKNGDIGGLGVDVYSVEPFGKEHPFNEILGLHNVLLTPHMAWGSFESRGRCVSEIAKNITAFYKKEIRNRIV